MPNMRDVAKRAGVGIGTVSRALSGKGYVSEETEQKIQRAIRELEYVPRVEEKPAEKRTGLIGVVIPDIEHPFFARLMRCFDMEITKWGYKTVFCNTLNIMNRQQEMLEMLEKGEIDGIITCCDAPTGFRSQKAGRIVSFDRFWTKDVPYVRSNHEQGGKMAADLFLKGGCRRIVQFVGGNNFVDFNQRHRAVEERLKQRGCEVINIHMEWNSLSYVYNKQMIQKYRDIIRSADGCLMSDIGAVSCLELAKEMKLNVPKDLRIVSYDGSELTNLTTPELTVIQQDFVGIAEACMELLREKMAGNTLSSMCREVPVTCIERGTT